MGGGEERLTYVARGQNLLAPQLNRDEALVIIQFIVPLRMRAAQIPPTSLHELHNEKHNKIYKSIQL